MRCVSSSQRSLRFAVGEDHVVFVRRGKEGLQSVVVVLRNWIELVVVAASATDREAKKCRAHDIGSLGKDFVSAAGDQLVAGISPYRS